MEFIHTPAEADDLVHWIRWVDVSTYCRFVRRSQTSGKYAVFEPSIPEDWNSLRVKYTYLNTIYEIEIIQSSSFATDLAITVDGTDQNGKIILLNDDNQTHSVTVKWNGDVLKTDTKKMNIKQADK